MSDVLPSLREDKKRKKKIPLLVLLMIPAESEQKKGLLVYVRKRAWFVA